MTFYCFELCRPGLLIFNSQIFFNLIAASSSGGYSVFIQYCPLTRDGQIHLISSAIACTRSPPSLGFSRFSLLSLATHLKIQITLKTLSSFLLSTWVYHLTPFTLASRSIVFFHFSMSICFSVVNFLTAHGFHHSSLHFFLNCFFIFLKLIQNHICTTVQQIVKSFN